MTVPKFRRTLKVDGRLGRRPKAAGDPAGEGLSALPPISMANTPIFLSCPGEACGFEWRSLPAPAPAIGLQPVFHKCRRCSRWWVIVYRVTALPRVRLRVVRVVESKGRHPERIREALLQVPELDEDVVELAVFLLTAQPGPSEC